MNKYLFGPILFFARHGLPVVLIFFAALLIRSPIFFNSDHFFSNDEGLMANTILRLLNGGPIVFYYDFARYFGLTGGLLSIPFMWILGFNTMAFNMPATLFFSLYLWTFYLLAKVIVPRMAILVLVLILISPPFVTQMTTHNWPHIASAFLGNLIFLLFIEAKNSKRNQDAIIFFLFFSMGLAIYTYTFSLIYISVVAFLYFLSHPRWNEFRQKISFRAIAGIFKNQETKRKIFTRILDVLIVLFIFVIVFSYIFGGFGLDIAGVSIFQVNNLHKPVIQLFVILLLRILIHRQDLILFLGNVKAFYSEQITGRTKNLILLGGAGFFLGLSPRIASILIGETSRGGQGFDVDFNPVKLLAHILDIFVRTLPKLFSLENSFQSLTYSFMGSFVNMLGVLIIPLLLLFFASAVSFCFSKWSSFKSILSLKEVKFDPVNIFIILPFLTCLANVLVQNGSEPRYLFPMFGTFVLWVGVFVNKFQEKVKALPIFVLVVWVGYYTAANYKTYEDQGLIDGVELIKLERIEIYDLVEFLKSKNIKVAYSNYGVSQVGTFLSEGKINISEFSDNPAAKTQKRRSLNEPRFAIIAPKKEALIYRNYLLQNKIEFKVEEVGAYKVYWEFSGDQVQINKLRLLIRDS